MCQRLRIYCADFISVISMCVVKNTAVLIIFGIYFGTRKMIMKIDSNRPREKFCSYNLLIINLYLIYVKHNVCHEFCG